MSRQLMRNNLPDEHGFLPLQNKILEIMVYIDSLCKENAIEYCLMGGSALGAKRHGGFIPWDDDLDIFMTPENYEKFREVFNNLGDKDQYYLQQWGLADGMVTISKVRMNGTAYIEESFKDWDIHQGIYVDIFILHTCPNNKLQQLHQCFWAKYVKTKGLSNRGYARKNGILGFAMKCMKLLPGKFLIKHGLKQVYKYRNKKTDYYCNFLGKAVFKQGIYKKEWFDNPKYLPFETVTLKAPNKIEDFLTDRFGDYMKIPSPERIKWEQHAWKWSVNKDFRDFVCGINDYRDESKLI